MGWLDMDDFTSHMKKCFDWCYHYKFDYINLTN